MDSSNKQVSIQDGQGFARKHDIKIISEVSAQTGENVDSFFQKVALSIYQNKEHFVSKTTCLKILTLFNQYFSFL